MEPPYHRRNMPMPIIFLIPSVRNDRPRAYVPGLRLVFRTSLFRRF